MKKWSIRILILLAVLVVGALARRTVFSKDPLMVRTARASIGNVESTISNSKSGTVKARRRAELSTGTSGIVVSIGAERGAFVEQGQELLRLDDARQQGDLAHANCQLDLSLARSARACLVAERAKRTWERNDVLAEGNVVSTDKLDRLKTDYDLALADCGVAAADVELARAAVKIAESELEKTRLVAPFDAIIADTSVELGEWVTPSVPLVAAPDLIDAIDPSSLYISAPMDEVDVLLLSLKQRVRVTIDSHPDQTIWAGIVRLAPYVLDLEQQNRTLEIEVELDDAELSKTLLPGTSADVEVILDTRDQVVRIPTYAMMEGNRVLLLEGGLLVEREVETGVRNWDWTEITSGLNVGELVVTSLERAGVEAGVHAIDEQKDEAP